jgi:hypothetical protein
VRYTIVLLSVVLTLILVGCEPPSQEAHQSEQQKQSQNYEGLTKTQEAQGMAYSPTRDNLNKWADTWEEQGKLSYVYLIDQNGNKYGYYIFEGLPVSYCASLTPPDKVERDAGYSVDALVRQAPAIDGVYYAGAFCQQVFGFDAISGTYYEFTVGGGFNYFLSDQPMDAFEDFQPLGEATPEKVQEQ